MPQKLSITGFTPLEAESAAPLSVVAFTPIDTRVETPPPVGSTAGMLPPSTVDGFNPSYATMRGTRRRPAPAAPAPTAQARPPVAARGTQLDVARAGARAERAVRAPAAGMYRGATSGLWGLIRSAADLAGFPSIANYAGWVAKGAQDTAKAVAGPEVPDAGAVERAVYGGLESAGQSLPALMAGVVTGSPAATLGIMGAQTAGESYQEAREEGVQPTAATLHAISQGMIEAATERIPAVRLLEDLAQHTGVMRTITRQLASEVPGEQAATLLQDLNDWAILNPEKPFSAYVTERDDRAVDTLVSTIVATIAQTGGAVAATEALRTGETQEAPQPAAPRPAAAPIAGPVEPEAPPEIGDVQEPPALAAAPLEIASVEPVATDPAAPPTPEVATPLSVATFEPTEPSTHKYASTQTNLPPGVAAEVSKMAETIPDEDLSEHGRETEPHITVKYGLTTEDVEEVRAVLKDEPPIQVTFGKTSHFADVEDGTADAVKIDIESEDLRRLHAKIAEALDTPGDTHPDYKPHATLAYVKPGLGAKYDGRDDLEGQTVLLDSVTFSARDGSQHRIPLTGTRNTQPEAAAPAEKSVEQMSDEELAALVIQDVEGTPAAQEAPRVEEEARTEEVLTPAPSTGGPTVTYNTRFESVEITFPEKPSADVLAKVKAAGYRWAKARDGRPGHWYRKVRMGQVADRALADAHALVGTQAQIVPPLKPAEAVTAGGVEFTVQPLATPSTKGPTPQVPAMPGTAVRLPSFVTGQQRKPTERDPQGRVVSDGPPAPKPPRRQQLTRENYDSFTPVMSKAFTERGVPWPTYEEMRAGYERWTAENAEPMIPIDFAQNLLARQPMVTETMQAVNPSWGAAPKSDKAFVVPKRTEDGGVRYVAEPQAGQNVDLDARKAENAKKRAELIAKLRKDIGAAITANVDPTHVATMIGIVRTYLDDGVVEVRKAALALQADWQAVTGETFPEKLRAYFAAAWKRLRGETVDIDSVFGEAQATSEGTADENRPVASGETGAAEPDGQGSGRAPAGDSGAGTATRPGGDAAAGRPGTSEGGPVPTGRRPVGGRRPVRTAEVAEPEEQNPALGAEFYRISDADQVGTGTPRERVTRNLAAIRIVKALEAEGRRATPEEQQALVQYVGWGGLPRIFEYWKHDEGDDSPDRFWMESHTQLKELLSPEEYAEARNSTQNAHYTSPTVIRAIWDAVRHLGVSKGSALEPSAGVGHFLGLAPDAFRGLAWATVEKDGITAAIGKALYPGAYTQHSPFEDATLPDNHFALVVSNVPFGNIPITDQAFTGPSIIKQRIHNYFFAKALDKVAPGGLVAFVTSKGTLDARDEVAQRAREYIASRADFVGAIRLPFAAFKKNANTEVVTDIIFLRKRHEKEAPHHAAPWLQTVAVAFPNKEGAAVEQHVNEYMLANPRMVLGRHESTGKMHGRPDQYNVVPPGKTDAERVAHWEQHGAEQLAEAIRLLPANVVDLTPPKESLQAFTEAQAPIGSRPFEFLIHEDRLAQNINGRAEPVDVNKADEARIRALLPIRAALRDVYDVEAREDATEAELATARKALNKAYDAFVKKHGPISLETNWTAFREDPDLPLLLSLEEYDEERGAATKTAVFTRRLTSTERKARKAESPEQALLIALGETARVDLDRIGELLEVPVDEAARRLQGDGLIIETPSGWQLPAVYLSGNVRVKLAEAEAAAKLDPRYQGAVDRLKAVIPPDLPAFKINVRLGASWVPREYVEQFITSVVNARYRLDWTITYTASDARWGIDGPASAHASKFDTPDVSTKDLLLDALNDRRRTIKRTIKEGDSTRTVIDNQATALARQRREDIHKAFRDWLLKDDQARSQWAVRTYNDVFNAYVEPKIDGAFLTFPGMSEYWRGQIAEHQRNAVARVLLMGNTLLAHVVGAGKTLEMTAAAMEMKRLGLARKPLFVVPNHLISQAPSEILQYYPNARVFVATPQDLQKEHRKRFTARIASGNWDAVVMPYSAFVRVSMSVEAESAYHREILDDIETAIIEEWARVAAEEGAARGRRGKSKTPPSVKRLENMRDRIQARLDKLSQRPKDDMLDFEQIGVDALFVDEAHSFKNLYFATRQQAAGIPSDNDAQRATDLYLKVRHINKLSNYRNVVLATGTPVSNSMAEVFVMQKLLQEHALERAGVAQFDAWLAQFGQIVAETELDPSGTGMSARPTLKYFRNLPDLAALFRQVADVKMIDDLPWLKARRPKLRGGAPEPVQIPLTDQQSALLDELKHRADNLDPKDRRSDNMPMITTDGRMGMLDMRLLDRRTKDHQGNKMHKVAAHVGAIFKEYKAQKGTQLVFLDGGTPGSDARSLKPRKDRDASGNVVMRPPTERERNRGFDLYADLKKKLVKQGIPAAQIAFIHDIDALPEKKQDAARKALFRRVREGEIRVLIGSTNKMGTGMNVQDRLVALHNVDPAWKPSDIEQRNGRILRQGNLFTRKGSPIYDPAFEVRILNYVTVGQNLQFGFDAYMWQLNERKAAIVSEFFVGDVGQMKRDVSLDLNQTVLTASEMKAVATGNPLILELSKTQGEVQRLEMVYQGWEEARREAEYMLGVKRDSLKRAEEEKARSRRTVAAVEPLVEDPDARTAVIGKEAVTGHSAIGDAIVAAAKRLTTASNEHPGKLSAYQAPERIGTYRGLVLTVQPDKSGEPWLMLRHPEAKIPRYASDDPSLQTYAGPQSSLLKIDSDGPGGQNWRDGKDVTSAMNRGLTFLEQQAEDSQYIKSVKEDIARYEQILQAPFENEAELKAARAREEQLSKALGVDRTQDEVQEIDADDAGVAGGEDGTAAEKALDTLNDIENKAKSRLKGKLGQITSGIDPTIMADLAIVGAVKIAKGVVKFADWSAAMVREFGEGIRPHLPRIFEEAQKRAGGAMGPRPIQVPSDRAVPPTKAIPAARTLEFPSLEKMPEAIRDELRALIEQHQGFQEQRRGVQSWARTQELAKDTWLPLETLKPGTALNAEELEAYKTALATVMTVRNELLDKVKTNQATDVEKLRFSYLTDVATTLTMSYRGAKAEAGRALNVLRAKARVLELQESAFLQKALEAPGADLQAVVQASIEAQGDPVKQLAFLRRRLRGDWFDYVAAVYYANLLSGVKTHLRNAIGNSFNVLANLATPVGAAPIDWGRARSRGADRSVYLSEIPHALAGTWVGLGVGFKNGIFTFAQGFRPATVEDASAGKFDTPRVELPGGVVNPFNWPARALEASDEFFRAIAKHQELYAGAYVQARSEGLTRPREIAARMATLLTATDPTTVDGGLAQQLVDQANTYAARAVFQEEPGWLTNLILKLKSPHAPLWVRAPATFVIPFVKTPAAILRQGLEYSPAGFVMRGARQSGRPGAQARGRAALGSAFVLGPIAWLAANGLLTGAPPDDEGEREEFYALGKMANAVKIGQYWVRYALFQPFSVMLAAIANAWQQFADSGMDEGAAEEAFVAGVAGAGASMLDQSFLSGLGTLIDAVQEPNRYAGRWLALTAQGAVPFSGMARNVTQAVDPVYRRPEGVAESVQAIIPGASDTLTPRRTRFGEAAERTGPWWQRGFVVPEVSKEVTDDVTTTLARLRVRPVTPDPVLTLRGERVTLSREQQDVLIEALGRETKVAIEDRMRDDRFAARADEVNVEVLERAMGIARQGVRSRALRALQRGDALTLERLLSTHAQSRLARDRDAFLGTAPESEARAATGR